MKPMRPVGIKVLYRRLSKYVRMAAAGETVLVADRDRVVAEIGPPRETRSPILAGAVRKGLLTPPALPIGGTPSMRKPVVTLAELVEELGSDRSER